MIADQHMPIVCRAIVKGKQTAGSSLELIATHGYNFNFHAHCLRSSNNKVKNEENAPW